MNTPDEHQDIDLQIAEIVSQWMDTSDKNRLSASELIARHPELAPGLAECLAGLHRIEKGKSNAPQSDVYEDSTQENHANYPIIPDFEVVGELGRGGMGLSTKLGSYRLIVLSRSRCCPLEQSIHEL